MWIFFIVHPLPVIVRRICLFENFEKLTLLLGFLRDKLEGWARGCCVHIFLVELLDDVDDKLHAFELLYLDILNEHAPLKQVHARGNQVPSMTED